MADDDFLILTFSKPQIFLMHQFHKESFSQVNEMKNL